jgi:hypothetical protein
MRTCSDGFDRQSVPSPSSSVRGVPTLTHASPPKTSKAKLNECARVAAEVNARGVTYPREVSYIGDTEPYNPDVRSMGSVPNLDTYSDDARGYDTPLRDWSTSLEDRDTQQALAEIAWAAFSRAWPGTTGPTDARVLAGLLQDGGLTVATPLDKFAHDGACQPLRDRKSGQSLCRRSCLLGSVDPRHGR